MSESTAKVTGTGRVKRGMAEMLKGGVIMDVVNVEQAKIAEDAGAVAVMALERVPADIRAQGGVARMSDPDMIEQIQAAVSIPVMANARIGHCVEAQVLQSLGVDYIDESEVLTPADYENHIDKWNFTVPFVCGATNLGEAETGKLPVVLFTAGGIATPADAAMMMQLGADGVFVGSGIFKSGNPAARASACVKAVTYYTDAKIIADVSRGLGDAMVGINVADIPVPHRLAERGW